MAKTQTTNPERERMKGCVIRWANLEKEKENSEREIDSIDEQLSQLYGLRPVRLNGAPGGTGIGDPTGAAAAKNEEKVASLKARKRREERNIERLDAEMWEFKMLLSHLPAVEKKVLELRYRKHGDKSKYIWQPIGDELGYSADHAKRLERQAISRLIAIQSQK